jgi:nucleolar protein 16
VQRNRNETLTQNYKRLGLSARLEAASGGVERRGKENAVPKTVDSLAIPKARNTGKFVPEEVRVEKDPETGRILRVIRPEQDQEAIYNPLNDPLNEIMDIEPIPPNEASTNVVAELEKEAEEESKRLAKRRPRQQSQREEEWIERLVEKHGDNLIAMVRDPKLNPMQQTEGDIARRIRKWKKQRAAD